MVESEVSWPLLLDIAHCTHNEPAVIRDIPCVIHDLQKQTSSNVDLGKYQNAVSMARTPKRESWDTRYNFCGRTAHTGDHGNFQRETETDTNTHISLKVVEARKSKCTCDFVCVRGGGHGPQ